MDTELHTARLWIRRGRPEDLEAYHALVSDYEVVRYTASWPWPPDRAHTASRARPYPPEQGLAGPVLLGETIVGIAGVTEGELGYSFGLRHWGRGYATEISRALIAHGFARYDWPEITAGVFEGNPASARVLAKLGFAEIGAGEEMCRARGGCFATRRFALTRADWQARHG